MEIQFNTDHNIKGSEALVERYQPDVEAKLQKYQQYLTHVAVYLADENSSKPGTEDKRCTLEVRIKGKQSDAVTHKADTLAHALNGALDRLRNKLEREIGQLKEH